MVEVSIVGRGQLLIITIPSRNGVTLLVVSFFGGFSYVGAIYSISEADAQRTPDGLKGLKPAGLVTVTLQRESNGAVTLEYSSGETKVRLYGFPAMDESEDCKVLYSMKMLTQG